VPSNNALAIVFACTAYIIFNVGLVLMKKGASAVPAVEQAGAASSVKNFLSNRTWVVGFLLTNFQMLFFWLALGFGPLSLIMPMSGVGMVVLVALSVKYLGEKVSPIELVCVAIIVVGVVVVGAASRPEAPVTWEQMLEIMRQPVAITYVIVVLVVAIIPVVICISLKYKGAAVAFGFSSGVLASMGVLGSKAMMAGFDLGGATSFWWTLSQPMWWLFFFWMLAGNTASLVIQNMGFQKGKSIVVTPLFTVMSVIFPIVAGIIVFDEWVGLSRDVVLLQTGAVAMVLVGVLVLSYFNAKTADE
jgi:drug/metabolite transporter (DMT)-like permease